MQRPDGQQFLYSVLTGGASTAETSAPAGRINLPTVVAALRHIDASTEPGFVLSHLAAVAVPAVCDEVTIDVTEDGGHRYRIRRPDHGNHPPRGDGAERAADGDPGGIARATGPILTRDSVGIPFSSPFAAPEPAFAGTVTCRWTDGYRPSPADTAFVGIMVEHAVALVLRERSNGTRGGQEQQNLSAALLANQRTAHAVGVVMAMHHLAAPQAMDLLVRVSDHTHRQLRDVVEDVVHGQALPDINGASRDAPVE